MYEQESWKAEISLAGASKRYVNQEGGLLPFYAQWSFRIFYYPGKGVTLFFEMDNGGEREYSLRYGYPYKKRRFSGGMNIKF